MLKHIELPNRRNTHLTDFEIEFIQNNWSTMTHTALMRELNIGRVRKISIQRLYSIAYKLGIHKSDKTDYYKNRMGSPVSADKLTRYDRKLVKREFKSGRSLDEILILVNMTKDLKLTKDELKNFIDNAIIYARKSGGGQKNRTEFSVQDNAFIMENYMNMSHLKISNILNQQRKIKMHESAIRSQIKRLGLTIIKKKTWSTPILYTL